MISTKDFICFIKVLSSPNSPKWLSTYKSQGYLYGSTLPVRLKIPSINTSHRQNRGFQTCMLILYIGCNTHTLWNNGEQYFSCQMRVMWLSPLTRWHHYVIPFISITSKGLGYKIRPGLTVRWRIKLGVGLFNEIFNKSNYYSFSIWKLNNWLCCPRIHQN